VNWSAAEVADAPPTVVTTTSTVPADAAAGVTDVIVVEFTSVNDCATEPNISCVAPVKFVPVIVTCVPPVVGPELGLTDVIAGAGTYVYLSAATIAEVPPGVVTRTSTWPAAPAGEIAVIDVAEFTTTPVAALPPNATVAPATKFVPVMDTDVPPTAGPWFGLTAVTVGTAMYV
jgi:hypothetical protein